MKGRNMDNAGFVCVLMSIGTYYKRKKMIVNETKGGNMDNVYTECKEEY